MKNKFWHPYHSDNYDKHAEWDDEMGEETWELVVCPANKGHQRGGKRLVDLSVVLPGKYVEDFVWTWYSDCLIQDHVLSFLREQRFTGFDVKPVKARYRKKSAEPPPKLWELVVTGWGGMAPSESGIEMTYHCDACGLTRYSGLSDPDKLIDERRWDASDFFMVWPLPGFIFVTDRVASAIQDQGFSGVVFTASTDLRPTEGLGAGRLSYYMPEQRAREIGEPLGIY